MKGLLDVLSKLVEDGRWLRQAVSWVFKDVCEQVDVVRRNETDLEKTKQGTGGRDHRFFGLVEVVFPRIEDARLPGTSSSRCRRSKTTYVYFSSRFANIGHKCR